ncbi:hypothetical protein ACWOC1_06855 [Enterococcus quebecensis]|uniref:Uncharacterized protein n=1 Tax=Enterococcus quebecensis TaxID=903983 RepID=A0A1E5GRX2_9ENTE|nr:hypothetical protein [Enterococcus quebecensis]OEG15478.1 hypothetical protein BCR23_08400 [Enterococcus quebecensis]OJG74023.1 hypothetical protein RV12_GL000371 [Enterococcus quebecensis]
MKLFKKLFIVTTMLVFFSTFLSTSAHAQQAETTRSGSYTSTTAFLSNLDMRIGSERYAGKMNDLLLDVDNQSFTLTFKLDDETHVFKGERDPKKSVFRACDRYLIDTIDDQKVGTNVVFEFFHFSGSKYQTFQVHTSPGGKTSTGLDVNLRTSAALYKK